MVPVDDPKQVRLGAIFGVPEGATGEGVVDAVFGRDGIDPELLPYPEIAGASDSVEGEGLTVPKLQEAGAQRQANAEVQDRGDLEALRELVTVNMIPGGDTDRFEELLAEMDTGDSDDWEPWELQLPDDSEGEHLHDLQAVARGIKVVIRMREVGAETLTRAPEHQVQPPLERVEAILGPLGNPERTYRIIHITGTNGKTPTIRMTEWLLAAGDIRTGCFTPPYLATIHECISPDGEPTSEEGFIVAWEDVTPYVAMVDEHPRAAGGPRLSFFEVLTVMALAAFADYPVDVAVIEMSLGGRRDTTNVVGSDAMVIIPTGCDHECWLGSPTIEIVHEKAGIIKDGSTAIVAYQVPEATVETEQAAAFHRAVVRREWDLQEDPISLEIGVLQVLDRQLAAGGQLVFFATAAAVYEDASLPLHSEYQAHSVLLTLVAVEAVHGGCRPPARIIEDSLASVTSPGRLEVLRSSPTVLASAGYNPHDIEAPTGVIKEAFGSQHPVAVLGVMVDRDAEGILVGLEPMTDVVVCVPIDLLRAMDIEDLGGIVQKVYGADRVVVSQQFGKGVERVVALSEGYNTSLTVSGILIVGSVVLATEVRALFGRS